jgi:hypothetical protein
MNILKKILLSYTFVIFFYLYSNYGGFSYLFISSLFIFIRISLLLSKIIHWY